jgi:magnesium transporter
VARLQVISLAATIGMTPPERNPEDRPVAALLAPDIAALLDESPADIAVETEELHPADLADVAELLPRERLQEFLTALGPARAADVLEYLNEELRTEFLEAITPRQAAELVTQMTPDDRADTLEEISEEHAEEILSEIPTEARKETEKLLSYEPDTAGGLMTTEFVSVSADTKVEDALDNVRAVARAGRREAMYAIYTTDAQGRVVGVMSLRELLAAASGAKISDVAWSEVVSVPPSADREEVARVIANYDLVAVPVVSESGHIMGVITVDDVIDAIQEEQTEDVQKFGGMEALDEPYTQIGFWQMIRKRAVWLAVLFVGEMFTTAATGYYQDEIARAVILAVLMPLIISSGGNSGSQATSLIIRAMALGELKMKDWWRVAARELPTGLTLGFILGALGFVRIVMWTKMGLYHDEPVCAAAGVMAAPPTDPSVPSCVEEHYLALGLTIWIAVIGVVTLGTMAGSMLPFALRRMRLDPASASAPFVATLVDVTGLVIYFMAALLILRGKLL